MLENILFAFLALILLIPLLYFLPLGFKKQGKLLIIGISLLLALLGLLANTVLNLWQTSLLLLVLALAATYLIEKRLSTFIFVDKGTTQLDEEVKAPTEHVVPSETEEIVNAEVEVENERVMAPTEALLFNKSIIDHQEDSLTHELDELDSFSNDPKTGIDEDTSGQVSDKELDEEWIDEKIHLDDIKDQSLVHNEETTIDTQEVEAELNETDDASIVDYNIDEIINEAEENTIEDELEPTANDSRESISFDTLDELDYMEEDLLTEDEIQEVEEDNYTIEAKQQAEEEGIIEEEDLLVKQGATLIHDETEVFKEELVEEEAEVLEEELLEKEAEDLEEELVEEEAEDLEEELVEEEAEDLEEELVEEEAEDLEEELVEEEAEDLEEELVEEEAEDLEEELVVEEAEDLEEELVEEEAEDLEEELVEEEAEDLEEELVEEEAEDLEEELVEEEAEVLEELVEEEAEDLEEELVEEEAEILEEELVDEGAKVLEEELVDEEAEVLEEQLVEEEAEAVTVDRVEEENIVVVDDEQVEEENKVVEEGQLLETEDAADILDEEVLTMNEEFEVVIPEENVKTKQVKQQMIHTMVAQLQRSRKYLSSREYESQVRAHLHPSLQSADYYTFSYLLIEHYISEHNDKELASLITHLKEKFTNYAIIQQQLQFLEEYYCKK
ncbi:hypothetical protein IM538_18130 [Cytobacillus suaedae]|nr:hypothetical protein IM538_18130 [Cytobacillus suaedae]